MCMSIGEHPKNEDLRVHRQPSEETKNAQKEDNEKFETYVGVQLSLFDQINNSTEQTNSPKNEETNNEKQQNENSGTKETPTNNTPVETQQTEQNNTNKPQEDNGHKPENEQQQKEEIKHTVSVEDTKIGEKPIEKPSFRENISDAAKSFAGKIGSFFSTAIEVVRQMPQVTREIITEIKSEREYETEKERILNLADARGIPVPEGTRESKYSDFHIGVQTLKTELWKDISNGLNNTEQTQREQSISDRVNSLPGADRPVFSPSEIHALKIVDQEPQELTNERIAIFSNFESMYATIETITTSNPDISISPEALREIEAKYAIEIREGSAYAEIHGSLVDDIHTLMEEAYLDSIRAKS